MVSVSKITIIGGSGFVGTNLCKMLADKQRDLLVGMKLTTLSEMEEKRKRLDGKHREVVAR